MTEIRISDRDSGRLSPEQCQGLHNASLEILARTGVRLYHQEAVGLLKKAGASVSGGNRWQAAGGKSLAERAIERVSMIFAEHQPGPLPKDIAQKIKAIVQRAEDDAEA
jgi:trimethylamine:corrinoid methyltransferase-like protein